MLRTLKSLFNKAGTTKLENKWPFDQPENCAVFTTNQVMKDGKDITAVYHDIDDDGWQFLHDGEITASDAMIVLLKNIVMHDPSILEVADIKPGMVAFRSRRGAPWQIKPNED